jgi:katanin p60 ATPase-containing subunit A1
LKLSDDIRIDELVKKTQGYSGADLNLICREAALLPMRKKLKDMGGIAKVTDLDKLRQEIDVPLEMRMVLEAISKVNKSVGGADLARYQTWMNEFGST